MNRIGKARVVIHPPLFAVLIAVCSWINIPSPIPFTMQIFGVSLTLLILGGKQGTISLLVYLFMGIIGLPVFHGFTGGPGILMSPTGGFLIGFLFMGIVYRGLTYLGSNKYKSRIFGLLAGIVACYMSGTAWFMIWYTSGFRIEGLMEAVSLCVLPFIIPDAIKLALALWIARRLERHAGKLYL